MLKAIKTTRGASIMGGIALLWKTVQGILSVFLISIIKIYTEWGGCSSSSSSDKSRDSKNESDKRPPLDGWLFLEFALSSGRAHAKPTAIICTQAAKRNMVPGGKNGFFFVR